MSGADWFWAMLQKDFKTVKAMVRPRRAWVGSEVEGMVTLAYLAGGTVGKKKHARLAGPAIAAGREVLILPIDDEEYVVLGPIQRGAIPPPDTTLSEHVANTSNPHAVTKAQVSLGLVPNVDATARAAHTGTQSADTLTDGTTNKAFLATERTKLTGIEALADVTDTANVTAAGAHMAGGVDVPVTDGGTGASSANAARTNLGAAASTDLSAHTGNVANPHAVTKAQVGLANADNTSDAAKPVSTATQTALNAKQPLDLFPSTLYLKDHFVAGHMAIGDIGELGWAIGSAGGTTFVTQLNQIAAEPGIFGAVRRRTDATAGIISGLVLLTRILGLETFDVRFRVRLNTLMGAGNVRVGLLDAYIANPANGMYIERPAGEAYWYAVSRENNVETRTSTGVGVLSAFATFRVRRIDAFTIGYSVNGGTEILHTTNTPQGLHYIGLQLANTTATENSVDIDWFDMRVTGLASA